MQLFKTTVLTLSLLLAFTALPAGADHRDSGFRDTYAGACIGGERCSWDYGNTFKVRLSGAPVETVRFYAHDDVGQRYKGKLEVAIDGCELASYLDVRRDGRVHELDARGARGRYLTFTAVSNDEIVIEDIEVIYRRYDDSPYRPAWDGPASSRNRTRWSSLPWAEGCFGGEICGRHGDAIAVRLSGAPVYGLRFYAHDAVGDKTGGRLRILLDGRVVAHGIDVKRAGEVVDLRLDGVPARRLVFEAATHDEVVLDRVEVLYGSW